MNTPIGENYPLGLHHINKKRGFAGAFGGFDNSIEEAARKVVEFLQHRDEGLAPFTKADFKKFYDESRVRKNKLEKEFTFAERLASGGYMIINGDECEVTHEFIATCFLASPRLTNGE
ncbi:MAG: hypothetical protein KBC15_01740 [Candidatus Levybacteria bacterium]|nr:hypothetical protein [Candidatus Levybacteria bacterium]